MNFFKSILVYVFVVLTSNTFAQPSDLTLKVMDELNINIEDCEESLFAEKVVPYDTNLSVIVIPKIGKKEEEMFTLDEYVVVVNNKTKIIKHLYFESYKTNVWVSDAIHINKISIDTTQYLVQENTRAFGIVLHMGNTSSSNPYSANYISLFVPDGDKLIRILKSFKIYNYIGETDMHCNAEFHIEYKTLILSKNRTNNYFDIDITILNMVSIFKKKGDDDCIETETSTNSKQVLKFSDGTYILQK